MWITDILIIVVLGILALFLAIIALVFIVMLLVGILGLIANLMMNLVDHSRSLGRHLHHNLTGSRIKKAGDSASAPHQSGATPGGSGAGAEGSEIPE